MMNFRELFNPSYNFIGLLLIALIITIILFVHKNIKYSIGLIGKTIVISGIITLVLSLLLSFGVNIVIPTHYQIFLQVITDNTFQNLRNYSLISIVIGGLCLVLSKIPTKSLT